MLRLKLDEDFFDSFDCIIGFAGRSSSSDFSVIDPCIFDLPYFRFSPCFCWFLPEVRRDIESDIL